MHSQFALRCLPNENYHLRPEVPRQAVRYNLMPSHPSSLTLQTMIENPYGILGSDNRHKNDSNGSSLTAKPDPETPFDTDFVWHASEDSAIDINYSVHAMVFD